jgi:hypothetical protein
LNTVLELFNNNNNKFDSELPLYTPATQGQKHHSL